MLVPCQSHLKSGCYIAQGGVWPEGYVEANLSTRTPLTLWARCGDHGVETSPHYAGVSPTCVLANYDIRTTSSLRKLSVRAILLPIISGTFWGVAENHAVIALFTSHNLGVKHSVRVLYVVGG